MTSLMCSFVCCSFVTDCQMGRLLGHVIHLLGTYATILCNWLIFWQNVLYLYLGRSSMCLILQETYCSSLILKSWRLDQEISEEKLLIKAGQIARQLLDTCRQIAQWLIDTSRQLRTDSSTPLNSWWIDRESSCLLNSCICRGLKLDTSQSIEVTGIQIFRSNFRPMMTCMCRVSFFTTLDLYKAYFKGRHIGEYKENECKRWSMPYSLWKKLLRLLRFRVL